jgi:hypothetical protein
VLGCGGTQHDDDGDASSVGTDAGGGTGGSVGTGGRGGSAPADPCEGRYSVVNAASVERIIDCTTLGNLSISLDEEFTEFTLPNLVRITGDLSVFGGVTNVGNRNVGLRAILLPALIAVDGSVDITECPAFEELEVPALESIGAELQILHNPSLSRLELPGLTRIGELGGNPRWTVDVGGNTKLTSVELPALAEVSGTLGFGTNDAYPWNSALSTLTLPSLKRVTDGGVYVQGSALRELVLPELASAEAGVAVVETDALERVELPVATDLGGLVVEGAAFTSLTVPALRTITDGDLSVDDAPDFTELELPSLSSVSGALVLRNTGVRQLLSTELVEVTDLTVTLNGELETIALPELATVGDSIEISYNDALESVDLSAVADLGDLRVRDCPALQTFLCGPGINEETEVGDGSACTND